MREQDFIENPYAVIHFETAQRAERPLQWGTKPGGDKAAKCDSSMEYARSLATLLPFFLRAIFATSYH